MDPLTEVGHVLKEAGEKIVTIAEDVISDGEKVVKVVMTAKNLSPEFKAALSLVVDDVKPIAVVLAPIVLAGGKDPVADFAALAPVAQDVVKLVKDFLSFVPILETAFSEVAADLK